MRVRKQVCAAAIIEKKKKCFYLVLAHYLCCSLIVNVSMIASQHEEEAQTRNYRRYSSRTIEVIITLDLWILRH